MFALYIICNDILRNSSTFQNQNPSKRGNLDILFYHTASTFAKLVGELGKGGSEIELTDVSRILQISSTFPDFFVSMLENLRDF